MSIEQDLQDDYNIAKASWLDSNDYEGGNGYRPRFYIHPSIGEKPLGRVVCLSKSDQLAYSIKIIRFTLSSVTQSSPSNITRDWITLTPNGKLIKWNPSNHKAYLLSSDALTIDVPGAMNNGPVWNYGLMQLYTGPIWDMFGYVPNTYYYCNNGVPNTAFGNYQKQIRVEIQPSIYFLNVLDQNPTLDIIDNRIFPKYGFIYQNDALNEDILVNEERQFITTSGDLYNGTIYVRPGYTFDVRRGYSIHTHNSEWQAQLVAIDLVGDLVHWDGSSEYAPSPIFDYLTAYKFTYMYNTTSTQLLNIYGNRLFKPTDDLFTGWLRVRDGYQYINVIKGIPEFVEGGYYRFYVDLSAYPSYSSVLKDLDKPYGAGKLRVNPLDASEIQTNIVSGGSYLTTGNWNSTFLTGWLHTHDHYDPFRIENGLIIVETNKFYRVSSTSNFSVRGFPYDVPNIITNYPGQVDFRTTQGYLNAISYINTPLGNQDLKQNIRNDLYQWLKDPVVFEVTCSSWLIARLKNFEIYINYPNTMVNFGKISSNIDTNIFIMPSNWANYLMHNIQVNVNTTGNAKLGIRILNNTEIMDPSLLLKVNKDGNLIVKSDDQYFPVADMKNMLETIAKKIPEAILDDTSEVIN